VLIPEQMEQIRADFWRWRSTQPPCGIPHDHVYNPCLPERGDFGLWCATCGLSQRLELLPGRNT
jgi:hypothetical protein